MIKLFRAFIFFAFMQVSCSSVKELFTAQDAESAIRELLSIGSRYGGDVLGIKGGISKEAIIESIFPKEVHQVLSTLESLGLSNEISRFSNTLSKAAEQTATRSVPVFLSGIRRMSIRDAAGIVTKGNTAATDYLRRTIGDTLRNTIAPVMDNALNEYNLARDWKKLIAPVQLLTGDKMNLDLGHLMSGLVSNMMFSKIEQKEIEIRTKAEARTSPLLQKVFSHVGNN